MAMARARSLLPGLVLLTLLLASQLFAVDGAVSDRRRGLKTHGLSDEKIKDVLKDHDPHHIINKHTVKEDVQHHPEVKRYLEWRQKHREGHPESGHAFHGKIPDDFLHHILDHHAAGDAAGKGGHAEL